MCKKSSSVILSLAESLVLIDKYRTDVEIIIGSQQLKYNRDMSDSAEKSIGYLLVNLHSFALYDVEVMCKGS